MPASETTDFEREFAELVRELRALPGAAPPALRERVRALGEPTRRRAISWRRTTFLLAPACAVALVAAAAVVGILSSSEKPKVAAVDARSHAQTLEKSGAAQAPARKGRLDFGSAVVGPSPGRIVDYDAYLRVRVKDIDALGRRSADAMRIARTLGGYVESVEQSTAAGAPGEADLVLRVPVARVQTALIELSALGTVLEQHLSMRDLNRLVEAQRQRILQLKLQIARITEALRAPLPADVRLRLQFRRDEARRNLASATGAKASTLREAALSQVSLSLTTQRAVAAVTKQHRGQLGRAVHGAVRFLAGFGAIALAVLIVLSPLLALAAISFWGVRTYRRREAQRLLAAP